MSDYMAQKANDQIQAGLNERSSLLTKVEKLTLKYNKLKQLLLLTDPAVSDQTMNPLTLKQGKAFIEVFPEEGEK